MRVYVKLGAVLSLAWSAGCVPLSEHRALERRFQEQERYVVEHRDSVRELERREQVLTLRAREQERLLELLRTRLETSETIRGRLVERLREPRPQGDDTLPASVPAPTVQESMAGLEVNPQTQGLVLENSLLFASGRADLRPEGRALLDRLIAELNGAQYRDSLVRVDGHTDDQPIRHSRAENDSNWDLSSRRALAVLHYLEGHGIAPGRLSFAGFGPFQPITAGSGEDARRRNRRVEIVLAQR